MGKYLFRYSFVIFLFGLFFYPQNSARALQYTDWIPNQKLPYQSASHQSIFRNNEVYFFGGGDSNVYHNDIKSSQVKEDKSLGPWINRGTLPQNSTWFSITANSDNIYLLGGAVPSPAIPTVVSTDQVYKSTIDTEGNLLGWSSQQPLPQPLSRGGSFVINNRIYYTGGLFHAANSLETHSKKTFFAQIDNIGNITNWDETTDLPIPLAEFAIFQKENYIYLVAGQEQNGQAANRIIRGEVNLSDGHINWQITGTIPVGLRRPAYSQSDDDLYIIGGYDGTSFTRKTYHSRIKTDKSTDTWEMISSELISPTCCNSAISANGSIYLLGGHDGSSYDDNVYRLDTVPQELIPSLKQYDPLWRDETYDSANIWSPGKSSIERWGCALTSATMILNSYGYNINPKQLNDYLVTNNGYTRAGGVVWGKISTYTKTHETNNKPVLEFTKTKFTISKLDQYLTSHLFPIIGLVKPVTLNSHFIVATGKTGQEYKINDPATNETELSFYEPHSYSTLNTFIPSHTNLSAIYLYIDDHVTFKVFDPQNVELEQGYEKEYALRDQVEGMSANTEALKSFYLGKPQPGVYRVEITASKSYQLDSYVFNSNGQTTERTFSKKIDKPDKSIIVINTVNNTVEPINFSFLLGRIEDAYTSKQIKTAGVYKSLKNLVQLSEKFYFKKQKSSAKLMLNIVYAELRYLPTKSISQQSKTELQQITKLLLETI